jgi:hypothetical protein
MVAADPPEDPSATVESTKVPTTFDGMLPGEPAEVVALASSQRDERLEAAATDSSENSASSEPAP